MSLLLGEQNANLPVGSKTPGFLLKLFVLLPLQLDREKRLQTSSGSSGSAATHLHLQSMVTPERQPNEKNMMT